jgi:HEAT repeat protein
VNASSHFELDSVKIGGRSFEQIVSGLEAVAREGKDVRLNEAVNDEEVSPEQAADAKTWLGQKNRLFTALAATYRKDPSVIDRALAIIRSPSPASDLMVSALGAAGTEPSQKALLSLMEDTTRTDLQRKAAGLALVRTKVPTVYAARELERLLADPYWHEYAVYGLGTYARRLGEAGDTAERDRIGALLVGMLRTAKDRPERLTALAGISNAGDPAALPAVRPFLVDQDPILRESAVQAIRLMKQPDVDGLLVEILRKDSSADVRVATLEAAKNRDPSKPLVDAVSERLLSDDISRVRMEALRLVIRWQESRPALRAVLTQVANREAENAIQRLAAAELAPKSADSATR